MEPIKNVVQACIPFNYSLKQAVKSHWFDIGQLFAVFDKFFMTSKFGPEKPLTSQSFKLNAANRKIIFYP